MIPSMKRESNRDLLLFQLLKVIMTESGVNSSRIVHGHRPQPRSLSSD